MPHRIPRLEGLILASLFLFCIADVAAGSGARDRDSSDRGRRSESGLAECREAVRDAQIDHATCIAPAGVDLLFSSADLCALFSQMVKFCLSLLLKLRGLFSCLSGFVYFLRSLFIEPLNLSLSLSVACSVTPSRALSLSLLHSLSPSPFTIHSLSIQPTFHHLPIILSQHNT